MPNDKDKWVWWEARQFWSHKDTGDQISDAEYNQRFGGGGNGNGGNGGNSGQPGNAGFYDRYPFMLRNFDSSNDYYDYLRDHDIPIDTAPDFATHSRNYTIWNDIEKGNLLQQMGGTSSIRELLSLIPEAGPALATYFTKMREMLLKSAGKYPGNLRLQAPPGEATIQALLQRRRGEGYDFTAPPEFEGGAYDELFGAMLPRSRRSYEELTVKPAEERFQKLGITGRPAREFLATKAGEQQERETELGAQIGIGRAGAERQAWTDQYGFESDVVGQERQTVSDLLGLYGRQEERGRRSEEALYSDWLRREGQPAQALQLGTPMAGQTFGNISSLLGQGQQRQGDMQRSIWELGIMDPYFQMMAQQPTGSGGGCCVIASVTTGSGFSPEVRIYRKYRDTEMSEVAQRGYYIFAEGVVPLIKRWPWFKRMMRKFVDLGATYLRYRLDRQAPKPGLLPRVNAYFFSGIFHGLGWICSAFTRSNGETVQESIRRHQRQLKWLIFHPSNN